MDCKINYWVSDVKLLGKSLLKNGSNCKVPPSLQERHIKSFKVDEDDVPMFYYSSYG